MRTVLGAVSLQGDKKVPFYNRWFFMGWVGRVGGGREEGGVLTVEK